MNKNDIEHKMSLFVQTPAFQKALAIINNHNYCVLSGIPGIGKTTLAQVLVTKLFDSGYNLITVRDNIYEALDLLDLTKKNVIYYDDFLGQSSIHERLGKNEDKGIIRLITEAKNSTNLKLILTTREYILEDAKRIYEPLNNNDLDIAKCIISVQDYTRGIKARIFYNHLFFSKLDSAYIRAIIQDQNYKKIIDHACYNPRIIEWMTLGNGASGITPSKYASEFIEVLNNPTQVWEHAFENQISSDARIVLYCLGTVNEWIGDDEIFEMWSNYKFSSNNKPTLNEQKKQFKDSLRMLDGSFIRSKKDIEKKISFSFYDPSIKDYVRRKIVSDPSIIFELIQTACYFEQISCLIHLSPCNGQMEKKITNIIPCNQDLYNAIPRTFQKHPPTYISINYYGSNNPKWISTVFNLGNRLSDIGTWSVFYNSNDLLQLACNLARSIIDCGEIEKISSVEVTDFLTILIGKASENPLIPSILNSIIYTLSSFMKNSYECKEWIEWSRFLNDNSNYFTREFLDDWKEHFTIFCSDELNVIMENAHNSSHAEDWFDQLNELAGIWRYPINDLHNDFDDWLEEKKSNEEEPDYDGERDWFYPDDTDHMTGRDNEIESLFDSLGEDK